jgi:hypothetical protein
MQTNYSLPPDFMIGWNGKKCIFHAGN